MRTANLPLAQFELFRTRDLGQARAGVERIFSPHRLELQGRASEIDVRYHYVPLADTSITYAQYGAAVRIDPGTLESFYLVGVPVAGKARLSCNGSEITSNAGVASVQSCTHPVLSEWFRGCRKITVKISRKALERQLAALLGRPLRRPVEFDLALDLKQRRGASWLRMIRFLLAELTPDSLYLASFGARSALDELLMSTLLFAQKSNYSEALAIPVAPTAPAYVRRAEEIIAAEPSRALSMRELAARCGSSVRSLQAGFRRHRGMTPVEFVRARRLDYARTAFERPSQDERVTDVALRAGYSHLGRFSREYKARYGESPSLTLARFRQ